MSNIRYEVVEHDGGWAYKVGDVFSETFRSHDAALAAARDASVRNWPAKPKASSIRTATAAGTRRSRAATTGPMPKSWIATDRDGASRGATSRLDRSPLKPPLRINAAERPGKPDVRAPRDDALCPAAVALPLGRAGSFPNGAAYAGVAAPRAFRRS